MIEHERIWVVGGQQKATEGMEHRIGVAYTVPSAMGNSTEYVLASTADRWRRKAERLMVGIEALAEFDSTEEAVAAIRSAMEAADAPADAG